MAYIPDEAVERMHELSAGGWRLYCCLARFLNHKTGQCNPSVATCAEVLQVHPKHIFKLRSELSITGWAKFSGDNVVSLAFLGSRKNATTFGTNEGLALDGSKNATPQGNGSKIATTSSKNATSESQKDYQVVAKMLPDGSKNATPYKEEPLNEQLNLTSKENQGGIDIQEGQVAEGNAPFDNFEPDFEPVKRRAKLDHLVNFLAGEFKLAIPPNERNFEKAAFAILARYEDIELAIAKAREYLGQRPGTKLGFLDQDFASWDAMGGANGINRSGNSNNGRGSTPQAGSSRFGGTEF